MLEVCRVGLPYRQFEPIPVIHHAIARLKSATEFATAISGDGRERQLLAALAS